MLEFHVIAERCLVIDLRTHFFVIFLKQSLNVCFHRIMATGQVIVEEMNPKSDDQYKAWKTLDHPTKLKAVASNHLLSSFYRFAVAGGNMVGEIFSLFFYFLISLCIFFIWFYLFCFYRLQFVSCLMMLQIISF